MPDARRPRIDVQKVGQVIWPGAPGYELPTLAAWARSDYAGAVPPAGGHARLAWRVRATADLFMAALMVGGDRAITHAEGLGQPRSSPLDAALEHLRGDRRLEAFVRISAAPTPPAVRPPDPWDDEHAWFAVGGADLAWFAASGTPSGYGREAAAAELARRAALVRG